MEISWYGLSCFRIAERQHATVVTDPFAPSIGLTASKLKGDIVTTSHAAAGHNHVDAVAGHEHVLTGPGEYEIGNVFITGVAAHAGKQRNVAFRFDFDGLTVAHLGDIQKVLNQSQIESLGQVNVLLLPVGGGNSLGATQAAELVSLIEPNYVIPMHYHIDGLALGLYGVERFLKEMGNVDLSPQNSLRVSSSSLPEETQTILLAPKG